jgi:hypothetical protein
MFSFLHSDTFQAGLYSLLNPGRRNHLVKHDAELSISAEPTRGTHLQYRTLQPASLGKKQVIGDHEAAG